MIVNQLPRNQYSNEVEDILTKEFDERESIITVIENKENDGYECTNDNIYVINPYTQLYIVCKRNQNYFANYYYKNDSTTKYYFQNMTNIKELSKIDNTYKILKNYAVFNNDKILKNILSEYVK